MTPYDRFAWSDTQIEQWLARGEHAAELCAYFGNAEHRQLSALARRAARLPAGALRVILVPGIMGSQLGLARQAPLPNDVLWIDPIDIQHGRLAGLRLPGTAPVVSLGVVLFSYLRLKLQLRARGFAVEFHDYDWRRPVQQLGEELAVRLRAAGGRVALVAHSMGGLVARMALGQPGTAQVERVVLLGTPNLGSFAAVQALRGTYAVVRKVARLVARGGPEELTREVFSSFPSLYDLLPAGAQPDLFDPAHWPRAGLRPRAQLLAAARAARQHYVPADERFVVIAGIGQETVTAVARSAEQFIYTITRHGDGTVPTRSAMLPGAHCVYARVAHSELTRDPVVAAAVVDLLNKGRTARLPARWRNASRARVRIGDRQLSGSDTGKVDWAALTSEQRRLFLENLNEPPHLKLRVPGSRALKPRRARVRRI